jgi:hypothetical protein
LGLIFAAGTVLRMAAVVAWPDPNIDVFVWLRGAAQALLHGHNPYTANYNLPSDLATYPPLPIMLCLPFSGAGLDVRYANVACDVVAAIVLYLCARRQGQHVLGALLAAAYLNLPGVPFMIINAWFEPMLAALLGAGIFLLGRSNYFGNILLGLGLTGKQFGLVMFAPVWSAQPGARGSLFLGIGLATAAIILPFLIASPPDFLDSVLYFHLKTAPDLRSLTLRSAVHDILGLTVPGWLAAVITLALTGWVAWRARTHRDAIGLWMGTVLMIFSLFYVKGYFNYYYLSSYLLLLGLAALRPEGETARFPRSGH